MDEEEEEQEEGKEVRKNDEKEGLHNIILKGIIIRAEMSRTK